MAHHYIGKTANGTVVSRKSTNPHFTHAAFRVGQYRLPSFSTSAAGAERNWLTSNSASKGMPEIVEVKEVSAKEYREATAKR